MPRVASLTAVEKVRRDAEIVRQRLSFPNRTWKDISVEVSSVKPSWGISERTCKLVFNQWQSEASEAIAAPQALEIVQEHIAGFRLIREELARVALEANGGVCHRVDDRGEEVVITTIPQPAVAVGAWKTVAELRVREIQLLQQTNLLPNNLGRIELDIDYKQTVELLLTIFQSHMPPDAFDTAENEWLDAIKPRQLEPVESGGSAGD